MKTVTPITHSRIAKALSVLNISSRETGALIGLDSLLGDGIFYKDLSPVDGSCIGEISWADDKTYDDAMAKAREAFLFWRQVPAPVRGDFIRHVTSLFRAKKEALGALVSYEMGKSWQEGLGEVQEMIDIGDFAVGLSRQLYGLSMHSERLSHRMYEQYHPLGIVGIISAFNFPVAVWSWNAFTQSSITH